MIFEKNDFPNIRSGSIKDIGDTCEFRNSTFRKRNGYWFFSCGAYAGGITTVSLMMTVGTVESPM